MTDDAPRPPDSGHQPLVALTGATGFVGLHLLRALPARGYRLRVLLRRPTDLPPDCASAVIGDLARPWNMSAALADVDAVIHAAGTAPGMTGLPEDDHRVMDEDATRGFAEAAERAGVKRFVFLSSVRAQCGPSCGETLTEAMEPRPTDAYGRSKLASEVALSGTGLDWVALRLALVYGAGARGNVAGLLRLARSPWPLPLKGLTARRSLLAVENLADALDAVLRAEGPFRRPLLAADPEPLTVGEMVAALREGLGRGPGLFVAPEPLVRAGLLLAGRSDARERLLGALAVDASGLRDLGWRPRVSTREGLAALARATAPEALTPASG